MRCEALCELRIPLNPLLGWSQLLQRPSIDPTTLRRGLDTIERNARLQTQLIANLLDASGILQGKLNLEVCAIDLVDTVRAAIETIQLDADAKHIALQFTPPDVPVHVNGDAKRLQQVAWNLLSNAVKFTPPNGQVEVWLGVRESVPATLRDQKLGFRDRLEPNSQSSTPNPFASLTISDTGTGINPDFLPHMFDRFRRADSSTTRSHGSLGLGLAIVRHIVELHDGTVAATNRTDRSGAVFTVQLPLAVSPEQVSQELDLFLAPHASPLANTQILVVDDEADTRELVAFVLQQAGATVTDFAAAAAALQAIAQRQFDLIVSDIGMPEMDGYQLMQQVRAQDSSQIILAIALTAHASQFDQQRA